ncbi:MAG: pyridoxamine 5'-phosphate oxidase family protein [Pseudomonadota bacterium]
MIDPELARFLEGPVMMLVAARGADGGPVLGRGLGCAVEGPRELRFNVGARQWADVLAGLASGDVVALTFVRPSDYRAVQIKGPLLALTDGDAQDDARAAAYRDSVIAGLGAQGVPQAQLDQWVGLEPVAVLRVRAEAIFEQTPGERAGQPLGEPGAMA